MEEGSPVDVFAADRHIDSACIQEQFGKKASEAEQLVVEAQKVALECLKQRVATEAPYLEKRDKFASGIPKLYNKDDPREYDLVFKFSANNPFFSNSELVKSYKLAAVPSAGASSSSTNGKSAISLDEHRASHTSWPLVTESVKIDWTSDEHDLTKKKPRAKPTDLEEYDSLDLGSFFCLFGESEDIMGVGEQLVDTYTSAIEIYANIHVPNDSDDEEDDDDDDAAEIDIEESEDEGKKGKKRQRTK